MVKWHMNVETVLILGGLGYLIWRLNQDGGSPGEILNDLTRAREAGTETLGRHLEAGTFSDPYQTGRFKAAWTVFRPLGQAGAFIWGLDDIPTAEQIASLSTARQKHYDALKIYRPDLNHDQRMDIVLMRRTW
jgi:hypothetical protein